MKSRLLVLLAGTSALLAVPLLAHSMPQVARDEGNRPQVIMVDDDEDDDEGGWSAKCGGDEGDDDEDGGCARQNAAPQNANPPSNGLFTPGTKPQVQVN